MVTTLILSDFSPDIKHGFIVDVPRNTNDFLHHAGRVGRAGQHGIVIIFGKLKGRGRRGERHEEANRGACIVVLFFAMCVPVPFMLLAY